MRASHFDRTRSGAFALAALITAAMPLAGAEDSAAMLEKIRLKHKVPAVAAAAVLDGNLVSEGATGLRRIGGKKAVTKDDLWHIGSCTKSMTASLAGVLVQSGKLRWEQTVGETLGGRFPGMDAGWKDVTLEQLLSHRGGAPENAPADLWAEAWEQKGSHADQRAAFVKGLLKKAPPITPGKKHAYSNQGYAIAGQMIEVAARQSWDKAMQELLFKPLGLKSAGFGAPGSPGKEDQPWGHRGEKPVPPGPEADNPPAIGPAGTAHLSISDFAKYAGWHARRAELLKPEIFERLHTAPPQEDYALGWIVLKRKWAGGKTLMHNGSNTMNYAVMWVAPERKFAAVAVVNAATPGAEQACDEACSELVAKFLEK